MRTETYTYKGVGKMYLRPLDLSAGAFFFGNAKDVTMANELEKVSMPDYTTPGGGEYKSYERVSLCTMTMAAFELTPENLAIAAKGVLSENAAGSVSDEEQLIWAGAYVAFDYMIDTTQTITASLGGDAWVAATAYALNDWVNPSNGHLYKCTTSGTSGGTEPTWPTDGSTVSDGTAVWTDMGAAAAPTSSDWTADHGGITMANSATGFPAGAPIKFSYTKDKTYIVEALLATGKEYEITFVGFNEAEEDRPFIIKIWKTRVSADGRPVVNDGYAEPGFSVSVMKDNSKGSGVSAYYKDITKNVA